MHILLTNDDGIHALGLSALVEGLGSEHQLSIVAPEQEQSAVGHAITLFQPLRVKPTTLSNGFPALAVSGTPADCVKIAVCELLAEAPDLIVSGINLGPNVGIDALYSGTVSAATEGAILGVPSLAVSLDTFTNPDFSVAVEVTRRLVSKAEQGHLPERVALNVNVPALPFSRIRGVALTRHGASRFKEHFDRRLDPRGFVYYWQRGNADLVHVEEGTDRYALSHGKISITPLRFDLTDYEALETLKTQRVHKGIM